MDLDVESELTEVSRKYTEVEKKCTKLSEECTKLSQVHAEHETKIARIQKARAAENKFHHAQIKKLKNATSLLCNETLSPSFSEND